MNHVSLCFHKYLIFKIDLNDFPDIFDNTVQFYSLTLRLMCQHLYKLPDHEKSLQRLDKGDPVVELLKSRIASLQIYRTFARKKTRAFCELHLNEFWKQMPRQKEYDILEKDSAHLNVLVEMIYSLAISQRTNFRMFLQNTLPSNMGSVVGGHLKSTNIFSTTDLDESQIFKRVASRVKKVMMKILQFKKVNIDAGADAGESDEGNGTPNEPDPEPDVVDELEDPFETEIPNNLEDNMETEENIPDPILEETESHVNIDKGANLGEMIDEAFKYQMRWTDSTGLSNIVYHPTKDLIQYIKTLLANAGFKESIIEIDDKYLENNWRYLMTFWRECNDFSSPHIAMAPNAAFASRYFYLGVAGLKLFCKPEDVSKPVTIPKPPKVKLEACDRVVKFPKNPWMEFPDNWKQVLSTSPLVSTAKRVKRLINIVASMMKNLHSHIDCLTYLHFSRKSSVKIDGVHSRIRDQIFPQQIMEKSPLLIFQGIS
jgi:hypothetical protein